MQRPPRTGVVVVAAGSGTRLGAGMPKAFVPLAGEPMLVHTLRGLRQLPGRIAVSISVPAGDTALAELTQQLAADALAPLGARLESLAVVDGGQSRTESVSLALAQLPECDVVLVHDAARALTPASLIAEVAGAVRATGTGIIPVLPVYDTVKEVSGDGRVIGTPDRSTLRAVQTPQGFPAAALREAYRLADNQSATDDAGTFAQAGGEVQTIAGSPLAFKVTTPADLSRAEQQLAHPETASDPIAALRVGIGTDAHAFDTDCECWLAGLHFPNEPGLSGHSDGDAAAHAIVDALLGAAGLGTIGSRFGTADPRYAGASGEVFLRGTVELLAEAGWRPLNASVQVVCRRPRFGDRIFEAGRVLSEYIGAPVLVSATTSDGLGFTGRTEGVFAVAVATITRA